VSFANSDGLFSQAIDFCRWLAYIRNERKYALSEISPDKQEGSSLIQSDSREQEQDTRQGETPAKQEPASKQARKKLTPKVADKNQDRLSPRRLKARKLAETAIQVIVTEQGTLEQVAERMPERFAHAPSRQNVYNRLQTQSVQAEIKAISEEFNMQEFAKLTKKKLAAIVKHTNAEKPTAPQAALMTVGLKLSGDLVERRENMTTQIVDLSKVKSMSVEEKSALLMELIRLEGAGVDIATQSATVEQSAHK
jgi:hypothetical protein